MNMSTTLFTASNQWAERPDDERFWTLDELIAATKKYAESAITTKPLPWASIRTEADNGEVKLFGKTGVPARLTYYAFGQLCQFAKSPANHYRELPATLASQCLNNRLKAKAESDTTKYDARIMFHKNGDLLARSITSELYDRVWNFELGTKLKELEEHGWRVPPARPHKSTTRTRIATEADVLPGQSDFGLSVKVGDTIAPAGVYASDKDMFVFLCNPERAVRVQDRYLMRALMARNSEVGDGSVHFDWILLDNICGNHICWGVEEVHTVRVRHIKGKDVKRGNTLKNAMKKFVAQLEKYEAAGAGKQELQLKKACEMEIGKDKDDVLDALIKYTKKFGLNYLTKKRLDEAYDVTEERPEFGSPRSVFGIVSGLTAASQGGYADERNVIDAQAGRLMGMVEVDF